MRKIYKITAVSFIIMNIIFCSCSSTNLLTISVTEPAPVYIPQNIKTVGIIDRSLPSAKNEKMDKFDKILSVEGEHLDKEGAHEAIVGLHDELINNGRFPEVKTITGIENENPGLGIFPAPVPWKKIEQICSENHVDAIFTLSFYDTDTKVDYHAVPIEVNAPLGIKVPAIEHHAAIATLIKTGWRIYDPGNQFILDEHFVNDQVVLNGVGINPVNAVKAVMGRKEAVLQVSNNIGHRYALRILPYRLRVSRHYYVRGTNNFKIAKRRAQTNDWDGAAELWNDEVGNSKRKVAGRACYNMAIINEINGELNNAIEWASKSYTDYKNRKALSYLRVLENRIRRNNLLQQQKQ